MMCFQLLIAFVAQLADGVIATYNDESSRSCLKVQHLNALIVEYFLLEIEHTGFSSRARHVVEEDEVRWSSADGSAMFYSTGLDCTLG